MAKLSHHPMLGHITTFGGNAVCCAAGNASLDVIKNGVLDEVEEKGALFEYLLEHNKIREIRRIGLMIAMEFETEKQVKTIGKEGIDAGVITYFFLSNRTSIRLAPPLTITESQIRKACKILLEIFNRI